MKVVLTVHQFLPDYASGTEILTFETAKELQKRGHHVTVFAAYPTRNPVEDAARLDRYVYEGVPVERFHYNRVPMGTQSNLVEMEYDNHLVESYFKAYIKSERPDVVHFFHLLHLSASPIAACHELHVPMVLTPTDFWFICPLVELRWPDNRTCPGPDNYASNCIRHMFAVSRSARANSLFQRIPTRLIKLVVLLITRFGDLDGKLSPYVRALAARRKFLQHRINLIDRVLAPTRLMSSKLSENGLETRRIVALPFGLNLSYMQGVRRPTPGASLRLGFIGTLKDHKGVHVLVQALRELSGKPIELKIYGKTTETNRYVRKLKAMAAEDPRIEFCGTFPNSRIGEVFSQLDALVVPSLWHENSPLVIYSAQAAGCPVIASDMAGMSEVIMHGDNGLLFRAGNVHELAACINSLLEKPDLLQQLSTNARRPLSIEEYADKLVHVYTELHAEAAGR